MHLGQLLSRVRRVWLRFPGRPYDPAAPMVFMHIPKTSGVALAEGLRAAIRPRRPFGGFDRVLFGGFGAFDSLAPTERAHIYLSPSEVPSDCDFVAAHMAFSTLWRCYGAANSLTILREPASRILSHWLYWRAIPEDQLAGWGKWAEYMLQARRSLAEFLSCKDIACQTDNLSVRMLLWPHRLIPCNDFIDPRNDEALFNDAIGHLKRFAFADVIEDPKMPTNLQAWLGRPVEYLPRNQTAPPPLSLKRPLHSELVPDTLDLIEARSRLDLRLWILLAAHRIGGASVEMLQRRAILRNVSRHAWLMAAGA
jgi:hypothetical protein